MEENKPLTIEFEINAPRTITDSVINTIILSIRDYKELIELGNSTLEYEEHKKVVNNLVNKINQEIENLYL